MIVPTALDLASERFLRPPKTACGIYVDRDPDGNDVHMRFTWASPDKWLWIHVAEPPAGAITNGKTNIIIQDGIAVLSTPSGEIITSHRLRNLFRPVRYDYSEWKFSPVIAGTAVGRQAWITSAMPTSPQKRPLELAFDAESGVLLFMRSDDSYLGFEELRLNEETPEDTFEWRGPMKAGKVGQVLVIPESDGTHATIWEVFVRDRPMFVERGPVGLNKDEAIAWGKQRAATVRIRET